MRLESFSVEDFRSITTARKITLGEYTLILGPNNEGKSNILHALVMGMRALEIYSEARTTIYSRELLLRKVDYEWDSDYPITKKGSKKVDKESRVTLEFALEDHEVEEFTERTDCRLNGLLPIEFTFGRNGFDINIAKPGRGHATINKNKRKVAQLISEKINFVYIPAVRTASSAQQIIRDAVERSLKSIETDQRFKDALGAIEELQKPILNQIAEELRESVKPFLPSLRDIELRFGADRYRSLRRDIEIFVDDGVKTSLKRKGDGIQSLVAVGLTRHSASLRSGGSQPIIAIEEPEAHLHPRAIHELREVIWDIASSSQVLVSSHSPLFVDRSTLSNNIIVNKAKAAPARSFLELREALGVRMSDNLQNARLTLLVEGTSDVNSIKAVISDRSKLLRDLIKSGVLQIDYLGSASVLSHKASFYTSAACDVHAFMDDDSEARTAISKAQQSGVMSTKEINISAALGKHEGEFEDLVLKDFYAEKFLEEFHVDVKAKAPGNSKSKWSLEMENRFKVAGKPWGDAEKLRAKQIVADIVAKNGYASINPALAGPIDSLIGQLEKRLSTKS